MGRLQTLILWDFCVQSGLDRAVTAKNSKIMISVGLDILLIEIKYICERFAEW